MRATGVALPDFAVNTFGVQVRYRYLLGPRSDLYLAYSRGGLHTDERVPLSSFELIDEALQLRDSDQLLAKVRYAF